MAELMRLDAALTGSRRSVHLVIGAVRPESSQVALG